MLWPPFWRLPWTSSANIPAPPDLPHGVTRTHIPTPQGALELLSAVPPTKPSPSSLPYLLLLHGGFGSAAVWLPYLDRLSRHHGIPCHALSLRGHGKSWRVGYVRMVFGTGLGAMEEDVRAVIEWLKGEYGEGFEVLLVGHSSGGGLAQWVVEKAGAEARVRGVALLAATPCFGQ